MARVIIDPGHGGTNACGGSSAYGARTDGVAEKHVNLELARRVAARLGSLAQLTRDGDVNLSLRERAELAARAGAQAMVSIHANAGGAGARGSEVWLHDRHGRGSAELARELHASLERVGPARGVFEGPLAVLDPAYSGGVAACLVEADYLSDPQGRQRLTEPRALDRLADAISTGVRSYIARFGDAGLAHSLGSTIVAREVSDPGGLNPRYRADQNIGYVTFYGYMRPRQDFTNRFIWLVWPMRRRPDDPPASIDIDLTIELYDRDPQTDASATRLDIQQRRVTLSEGSKLGYEYTRLPEEIDIYVKITYTDYAQDQSAGQVLWTNGYG